MSEDTEFRLWMRAMGLNGKQVAEAGQMLGITTVVASQLSRGKRDLRQIERLAMAALLVGFKPWEPDLTTAIVAQREHAVFQRRDLVAAIVKNLETASKSFGELLSKLDDSLTPDSD